MRTTLCLSLLLGLAVAGAAEAQTITASPVRSSVDGGEVYGTSILYRSGSQGRVAMTFNTWELQDNAPYTVWWVVFNNPELCETPCACGSVDFANADEVGIGLFWATGRYSDRFGQAAFAADLDEGELPEGEDQVPFADRSYPIEDEHDAEIHLVVRAHGRPRSPETQVAQLTQFNGGCPPEQCANVQFSIHPAPSCTP